MILIPALRAAGMACSMSWVHAAWPAPGLRPKAGERKKFCMSIMTRADLEGEMVMELLVVVWMVTLGPGVGSDGDDGCVRSKPFCEE